MVQIASVMDYDVFSGDLEWFIRLPEEARRPGKRYLIHSPLFFINMLEFKFRSG